MLVLLGSAPSFAQTIESDSLNVATESMSGTCYWTETDREVIIVGADETWYRVREVQMCYLFMPPIWIQNDVRTFTVIEPNGDGGGGEGLSANAETNTDEGVCTFEPYGPTQGCRVKKVCPMREDEIQWMKPLADNDCYQAGEELEVFEGGGESFEETPDGSYNEAEEVVDVGVCPEDTER